MWYTKLTHAMDKDHCGHDWPCHAMPETAASAGWYFFCLFALDGYSAASRQDVHKNKQYRSKENHEKHTKKKVGIIEDYRST